MLITELIRRGAIAYSEHVAVRFGDETLLFRDVDALSNQISRALIRAGVADVGARVALLMTNSLFTLPVDFACAKARVVRVPLNSRLSILEQTRMIQESGASVLIFTPDLAVPATHLAEACEKVSMLSVGQAAFSRDLLELAAREPPEPPEREAQPDDLVLALYTSGTTGTLKAATHTQSSWAAMAANILVNIDDIRPGEMMLHAASLIHASGTFILPYWVRGGVAGILPAFSVEHYCEIVRLWQPSAVNLVPTMLGMLLDMPSLEPGDFDSVRTFIYGASPMPRGVIVRALETWGPRFVQYYGQSEAPLFIARLTKEDHVGPGAAQRLMSCGQVSVDCEVRLIGEDGDNVINTGEAGEIVVRAPFAMRGYLNAADLNEQTILPGGWIRTRDVGRFDGDGYLYLVDRTSDMIVSGGYNVYPREVEDVLSDHPSVREVVVVGLPHEKWGEVVTAFVVRRDGVEVSAEDIIAYARDVLAAYKAPKEVRFIEEIPKSPVGKLLRRAVRDPFWAGRERRI